VSVDGVRIVSVGLKPRRYRPSKSQIPPWPALDTTEDISNDVNNSISQSVETTNDQIQRQLDQAEEQTSQSFSYQVSGSQEHVQKVLRCVQRASNDVEKIQRCIE
jgi:hypothetical protein